MLYYPIMLAAMLVLGIYLGSFFTQSAPSGNFMTQSSVNNADKISQIISFIDQAYVDTVARNELIDKAINSILQDLDPHSYYISAEQLASYTEPLDGNFDGIGIEFLIQNDTVRVVAAIEGGPSEKLGIQAGDRLVAVDGIGIAGVEISNEEVIKKLKGPRDTKVRVVVYRNGKTIPYEIVRGTIPINSVVTAQMLDNSKGFIKVSRFAKTTYEEFMQHASRLEQEGMTELILDLRGNGGGYLDAAVKISEEFLQKGQLIVYTEGKSSPRKSYYASKKGKYADMTIAVLINEGSASASEILAGALQDNDRGLIIGRRSFGKGLVQEHMNLRDNSALRLTVARYYTPTGRSIQKAYGENISYDDDYEIRYANGEFSFADSTHFADSLKFTTPGGRIVYGGGGIMPDIFVGLDTVGASGYLTAISYRGLLNQFGFDYADEHRAQLLKFGTFNNFDRSFNVDQEVLESFTNYALESGVPRDSDGIRISSAVIKLRIKSYIARNIWGNDGFYAIMNTDDNMINQARISLGGGRNIKVL